MWSQSKPADYLSFRVFIFGITSQSMFPNGVVYEGNYDNKPLHFRGESGANDSMVCFRNYIPTISLKLILLIRYPFWIIFCKFLCQLLL